MTTTPARSADSASASAVPDRRLAAAVAEHGAAGEVGQSADPGRQRDVTGHPGLAVTATRPPSYPVHLPGMGVDPPPGCQLEVPIGIRHFGIPNLSEYRFGIRTDDSLFCRTISDKHRSLITFQKT